MSFDSFNLHPQIVAGVQALGYSAPTPIQRRAIPPILQGQDVLGLAQTGTGKTAAFVLPILQRLVKTPRGCIQALVIAPSFPGKHNRQDNEFHRPLGLVNRHSFEARRTQRRRLFLENRERSILQKPPGLLARMQILGTEILFVRHSRCNRVSIKVMPAQSPFA